MSEAPGLTSSSLTAEEVVRVLAHYEWCLRHEGCDLAPDDAVPTLEELARWTADAASHHALNMADDLLRRVLGDADCRWQLGVDDTTGSPCLQVLCRGGTSSLTDLHYDWVLYADRFADALPMHPLAPLVVAWQERPPQRSANLRADRLLPSRIAIVGAGDRRADRLYQSAAHFDAARQTVLPGFDFEDMPPDMLPTLPLGLYDLGVGRNERVRGGAPLALRLFVEAVLAVPLKDRHADRPVDIEIRFGRLIERLYPGFRWDGREWSPTTRGKVRPGEYWPKLMAARDALASEDAMVTFTDPRTGRRGRRQVVTVSGIPQRPRDLQDNVRLLVDLPPGSHTGPVVSERLPLWGLRRAAHYRALIGLAYNWFDPGVTRYPVRNDHWVQVRDPKRYDRLKDEQLVHLCYPHSVRRDVRRLAFEARRVVKDLVDAGEAMLVDGRILPPATPPKLPQLPGRSAMRENDV